MMSGYTVLACEDSDEDYDTLAEAVREAGLPLALHRCADGAECLELLRGVPGSRPLRPSLLLLDLNTPGTDGREVLDSLKKNPALREIPVVVFTTSLNPKDVSFCYRAGANAYHVKPVRYDEHRRTLRTILEYWLTEVVLPHSGEVSP